MIPVPTPKIGEPMETYIALVERNAKRLDDIDAFLKKNLAETCPWIPYDMARTREAATLMKRYKVKIDILHQINDRAPDGTVSVVLIRHRGQIIRSKTFL